MLEQDEHGGLYSSVHQSVIHYIHERVVLLCVYDVVQGRVELGFSCRPPGLL
jgi:hypothetical protein